VALSVCSVYALEETPTRFVRAAEDRTMAKSPNSNESDVSHEPHEYVRVVPLHHPKPYVALASLGRKPDPEGSDLFDGKPRAAPANVQLTYRGGPLLQNVKVQTVFWGTKWSTPSGASMLAKLNEFFGTILDSPLIAQLAEYSVTGQEIGPGKLIGTTTLEDHAPTTHVTDSTIRRRLKAWIKAGALPPNDPNTLYFIYLDPGVVSVMGGSKSCQSYCGYHDHVGGIYYAVMPYPLCDGCLGGMNAFDALTGTSSHELCEAITDPMPGSGWYDDANGEIGDICAWNFKKVDNYNVQLEWSNKANKCI
jgi:hypothetical protein